MYNHIWKKYLPFINILLKKSLAEEQVFTMNRIDFERAGSGRKTGFKFTVRLANGRLNNIISSCPLAMDLVNVMLEDPATRTILKDRSFEIVLTPKFQLIIKNTTPQPEVHEMEEEMAAIR